MHKWFEYESGQAWCESSYSKYQKISVVAEFFNTITNIPIIILPMLNVFMLRKYITQVNSIIFFPHLLLTINGFASTYYHATLNLFGQLVDELSILWLINVCFVAYLPVMKWYPARFYQHINRLRWTIVSLTTVISILCFLKPSINAFALMTFSIPGIILIYHEGIITGIVQVRKFTYNIFVLWTLALGFWFSDRLLCDLWIYLGIPYLHAIFHLLSSLAAYNVFIMFSLLDIHRRATNGHKFLAKINYFPFKNNWFSFPLIKLLESKDIKLKLT